MLSERFYLSRAASKDNILTHPCLINAVWALKAIIILVLLLQFGEGSRYVDTMNWESAIDH